MNRDEAKSVLASLLGHDLLSWSVEHAPNGTDQANTLIREAWESCVCSTTMIEVLALTNEQDAEMTARGISESEMYADYHGHGHTTSADDCARIREYHRAPTVDELVRGQPIPWHPYRGSNHAA